MILIPFLILIYMNAFRRPYHTLRHKSLHYYRFHKIGEQNSKPRDPVRFFHAISDVFRCQGRSGQFKSDVAIRMDPA